MASNAELIAKLRKDHIQQKSRSPVPHIWCMDCVADWPCAPIQSATALELAEAENGRLREAVIREVIDKFSYELGGANLYAMEAVRKHFDCPHLSAILAKATDTTKEKR
jgi:hypothetical protein